MTEVSTEYNPDADHYGPQGWDHNPSTPFGFDTVVETAGSISLLSPGGAAPYQYVCTSDATEGVIYGISSGFGDETELWLRFYLSTNFDTYEGNGNQIVLGLYNTALSQALLIYLVYLGNSTMRYVLAQESGSGEQAYDTDPLPNLGNTVLIEVHYVNNATTGVVEGWSDGVAWQTNVTNVDTSVTGDVGNSVLAGLLGYSGSAPVNNARFVYNHLATSTTGRLDGYPEHDTKLVNMRDHLGSSVKAAQLGGVLHT
jgi:hypothetical protein